MRPKTASVQRLEPCPLVRRFAPKIAGAALGKPILDVACGSGRNAIFLANGGCAVICVDKNLASLQAQKERLPASLELRLRKLDLVHDSWPFGQCSLGGIVNVHYLQPELFRCFEQSLMPGGYLLLKTVPGCGGNYLELPTAGALRRRLEGAFDFEFYEERNVGPHDCNAVTVRLLARRRATG